MKKLFWLMVAVAFCVTLSGTSKLYAEESTTATTATSLQEEVAADKAKIKEQKEEMKAGGQAAKAEEAALKSQIKDATLAGDKVKAKELREKLKTTHQASVKQMHEDKKELHAAKKELRQDKKEARNARR